MINKLKRPKECPSTTRRIKTGCGHLYVTIGTLDGQGPIEIFAILGKAGGCSNCQNEALSRCISLGLKYGIPKEEYIEELRGLRCPSPNPFPEEEGVLSCADALSRVLREWSNKEDKDGPG